jgi:hypothetical protein
LFLLESAKGDDASRENVSILEVNLTAEQRAEGQCLATEWKATFEKRQSRNRMQHFTLPSTLAAFEKRQLQNQ